MMDTKKLKELAELYYQLKGAVGLRDWKLAAEVGDKLEEVVGELKDEDLWFMAEGLKAAVGARDEEGTEGALEDFWLIGRELVGEKGERGEGEEDKQEKVGFELEKSTESRLNYLERFLEQALQHLPAHWRERYQHSARGHAGGKAGRRRPITIEPMEKMALSAISPRTLRRADDEEILSLHHRLHQLAGHFEDGKEVVGFNWEDFVNVHVQLRSEMLRREMEHATEPRDRLDEASEQLVGASGADGWVSEEVMLVPDCVSVVGSWAKGERGSDLDVLVRLPDKSANPGVKALCESVELQVRKALDPEKEHRIHWIYNESGAHDDFIPKYHLMLVPTTRQEYTPVEKTWAGSGELIRVDLGCGQNVPAGYLGIDNQVYPGVDIVHDLEEGIPLPSNYADEVRAWHFLEHHSDPRFIMWEIWRVLKPNGVLIFEVPSTRGEGAFAAPTHLSLWNKTSFEFYADDRLREVEGIYAKFEIEELEEREVEDGRWVYVCGRLRAVKPAEAEIAKADRALKPIVRGLMLPKPAVKIYTDLFSVDELWEKWAAERAKNGLQAEVKYNGFRALVQKAGDRVSIFFEDAQIERGGQLADLVSLLKGVPDDFMLDCNIGIEENGKPWPRPRLMTLTARRPELPSGAFVKLTAFDILYWREDVHGRPFAERRGLLERFARKYFGRSKALAISPGVVIHDKAGLARAFRYLGGRPGSEGIVVKTLGALYPLTPSTNEWSKVKHAVEVKAWVLETKRTKMGGHNFRGGLLAGGSEYRNAVEFRGEGVLDLGYSFNSSFSANVGDVVTFEVEEIILQPNGEIAWLGAKPIDVDKERTKPYFANQVVDMARRGRVLQDARSGVKKGGLGEEGEEAGPRGRAALKYWRNNWWKVFPKSGRGRFVYHHHWRGLSEEEAKLNEDELMRTDHSVHGDLRLEGDGMLWGWSVFLGTVEANREADGDRLANLPADDNLQTQPKLGQPNEWLDVGVGKPYVSEPGGVGATSEKYSKFFAYDHGTYQLGVMREHLIEVFLDGKRLKGRYLIEYAPVADGARRWIVDRPKDQAPYAESHKLEDVLQEIRRKKQKWLIWAQPGKEPVWYDVESGKVMGREVEKAERFEPPVVVREAAALGLELRRKFGRGGTLVGVARARDLSNGRAISADTIQRMASYFARHAVDSQADGWKDKENPSAGWIAWLLWGGDPGRAWVQEVKGRLEKVAFGEEIAKADGHAGIMLAFFLPETVAKWLALPKNIAQGKGSSVESVEELHLTLAFMSERKVIDKAKLISVLKRFARRAPPIQAVVNGVGRFNGGQGEAEVFYASVDAPALFEWRRALVDVLRQVGILPAQNHGYIPHVTLAYLANGEESPERDLPLTPMVLDTLTLVWGDERHEFKLRGVLGAFTKAAFSPDAGDVHVSDLADGVAKRRGLYLVVPHGRWIASGRKKAVVKSQRLNIAGEPLVLVEGHQAYGVVVLGEPCAINLNEFGQLRREHRIGDAERVKWWPKARRLWYYPVERFEAFAEPQAIEVPRGVQTIIRDVRPGRAEKAEAGWITPIIKVDEARRVTLAAVLVPKPFVDSQADSATADEIEKACYRFMIRSRRLKVEHRGRADELVVVENYLLPQDLEFDTPEGKKKYPKGTWMLGVHYPESREDLWQAAKRGELAGFSIGGFAKRKRASG